MNSKKSIVILSILVSISIVFNIFLCTTLISNQKKIDNLLRYSYVSIARDLNSTVLNSLKNDLTIDDKDYTITIIKQNLLRVKNSNRVLKEMTLLNNNFNFDLDGLEEYLEKLWLSSEEQNTTTFSLAENDKEILNKITDIRFYDNSIDFYQGENFHHKNLQAHKYTYKKKPQKYFYEPHFKINTICEEGL